MDIKNFQDLKDALSKLHNTHYVINKGLEDVNGNYGDCEYIDMFDYRIVNTAFGFVSQEMNKDNEFYTPYCSSMPLKNPQKMFELLKLLKECEKED